MDYKIMYEQAIKRAKAMIPVAANQEEIYNSVITIFPELRESEDEKIRTFLHHTFTAQYLAKDKLGKWHGEPVVNILAWLEKQGNTNKIITKDEFTHGVLRGAAINLITWIDNNAAKGNMCLSNMECKDIEDALVSCNWDKIYAYMKKKLEKQGELVEINSTEFDTRLQALIGKFGSLPKEELIGSLSFWMNVVQNDGTYKTAEKQGEQNPCMIQWKGDNLKEVIDFTGKDKNFDKWFKSFEEYEKFVREHEGILKLFNEDGSHYEVPVGAWIVKTPDGRNVASKAVLKQKPAWSEEDKEMLDLLIANYKFLCKEFRDKEHDFFVGMGLVEEDLEMVNWLKGLKDIVIPQKQWKVVDKEIYVKEPALAQRKDKSEPNHGYVICYDHTLTPDVYERFIMISDIYNQSHWKPSDEQINALSVAVKHGRTDDPDALKKLLEQLKKL